MPYTNVLKCANEIAEDIRDFHKGKGRALFSIRIGNAIGYLQSGKSTLQQELANLLAPQQIFACTTYSNKEIVEQHLADMRPYYSVIPFTISTILSKQSPQYYTTLKKEIKTSMGNGNPLILMIDESEFRIGNNSILQQLIEKLLEDFPQLRMYILFVGATPISLRALAQEFNIPIKHFKLEKGENYFGLEEMLEAGMVYDTSYIKRGDEELSPHKDILKKLDEKIEEFDNGLYMLRVPARTTEQAQFWQNTLNNRYNNLIADDSLSIITAHTENDGFSIRESISKAERNCHYKRVILIVVGGLSAGYRLFTSTHNKKLVRFAYEPSTKNMTAVQGLAGRAAGYYTPEGSGPTICMKVDAIHEYSSLFDLEEEVIPSSNASTHTNGAATYDEKFIPCKVIGDFPIDVKKSSEEIVKELGYSKQNSRYSTNEFYNFTNQWDNSSNDNPNYRRISYVWGEVKEFAILIDKEKSVARVVQKTGDETLVKRNYHNSTHKNTSMFAEAPYSDFNIKKINKSESISNT